MSRKHSEQLFRQAQKHIPGGVNSPVRAFNAVGGTPRFIRSAQGPWLTDVDGKRYVDLICSWGPMLLGHAPPEVQAAVQAAVARGTSYGTPTEPEVELAEEIVDRTPVDRVRFVSSGTEATMSAIRLARGFTGRDVVVKFAGCYHGHVDSLLLQAPLKGRQRDAASRFAWEAEPRLAQVALAQAKALLKLRRGVGLRRRHDLHPGRRRLRNPCVGKGLRRCGRRRDMR